MYSVLQNKKGSLEETLHSMNYRPGNMARMKVVSYSILHMKSVQAAPLCANDQEHTTVAHSAAPHAESGNSTLQSKSKTSASNYSIYPTEVNSKAHPSLPIPLPIGQ
jgi:hypothetical protein